MAEVRVRARDGADGAPLAGAEVGVFLVVPDGGGEPTRGERLLGVADEHGTCTIEAAIPEGEAREVHAVVRAPGHAEWRSPRLRRVRGADAAPPEILRPGGSVRLEADLARDTTIRGTVRDAAGRPIDGAGIGLVLSHAMGCSWPHAFGVTSSLHWPPPCRTDTAGRFEWLSFPAEAARGPMGGSFVLLVEHPGFVTGMVHGIEARRPGADGVVPVDVVLDEGRTLEGSVLGPGGAPVEGATVTAEAAPVPGQPFCVTLESRTAAGSDGRWRLRGLKPGPHRLEVRASGHAPWLGTIEAGPLRIPRLAVRLERGADVEGRVLDGEGCPVAGAPVFGVLLKSPLLAWIPGHRVHRRTSTGADGRFRLEGFPARGRVEVRSPPSMEVVVPLSSEPIELRPPARAELRIALIAAEGGPVGPPAYVTVMAPGFSTILEADAEGICRRPGMPKGSYGLTANAPGRAVTTKRASLPEGGLREPIRIVLRHGRAVRGRVTGDGGAPLARVHVVAHGHRILHERRTETAADGSWELLGLDRFALLVFTAEGYALRKLLVPWTGSHTDPAVRDVRMGRGALVEGRVLRADGSPIEGARVESRFGRRPRARFEMPWALSGAEGRFAIRNLPVGSLVLESGGARRSVRAREGAVIAVELRLPPAT